MIIVDTALRKREADNNPVKVALVGAGYMGRGIARQIIRHVPGMRVAGIANRTPSRAHQAYRDAGVDSTINVDSVLDLEDAVRRGKAAVTDNPQWLCRGEGVDAIIECTGDVEFSAAVAMEALRHGKHLILMNAELDATLGPILKVYADRAGVVITNADGDQPGVMMNLFRFVQTIGCRPVLAGNIKGLQDRYRTPETQQNFARKHKITPRMAASFADGTKISMENAVVANATGFRVGRRGMYGPECRHVRDAVHLFSLDDMLETGLVDYILGAEPGPGVFVLGYDDDQERREYMRYFKMGDGPVYAFYVPYHLPHLEAPITAARAVLFHDAAVAPLGAPVCEVIATAKRDLAPGEVLDGIGGFTCYGVIDNAPEACSQGFLPMGLTEGCILKRKVRKDAAITYSDVDLPRDRLSDRLREEQSRHFNMNGGDT